MNITSLGETRFPSPISHTVSDQARIPAVIVRDPAAPKRDEVLFELAGPRAKLFFDPAKTRAGIVTCGGLCPGLNNVIRALFLELHHTYGVAEVLGFRGGYQGLDPARGPEPTVITPAFIDQIHQHGGTILGTSRGPVDTAAAVKLKDIGLLLRERIEAYFKEANIPIVMRYFDPSYLIRSSPANAADSVLCDLYARNAVHAAMAGKTGLVVGFLHDAFIHIPIEMLVLQKKQIDTDGLRWKAVLAVTGQPARFE